MRTLMIAPQPFFQPRGTPFSVLHRLKALASLGYKVDLLTYHLGEDVGIEGVMIYRIPRVPFVKNIAIGPSKRKIILDAYLLATACKMLASGNYDLIHSHEEAGFFASYLARAYKTLHLYDMHSSLPQQLSNFKYTKSKMLKRVFKHLESRTIDGANAVITICPELFNYVEKLVPGKFNVLIENVADNSLVFDSTVHETAIRESIRTNGEAIVLYTGTFEAYQGIDLLIASSRRIVRENQNVRFVLVGGKPDQIHSYESQVRNLSLQDHFLFTGSVAPEEVPAYIDASDILVSPRIEGNNTPLKIYSYLRSGKPIVATDHVTHTQVLDQDVSVLTNTTPESFGDGVLSVLNSQDLRRRITKNAKRLADTKYSYPVYLKKTKEVYQHLENKLRERSRF
ncbi:glycosyltransferase family 4 protein [bacterium]|nr:glycosyltransferase family 4 protein [bacterium]